MIRKLLAGIAATSAWCNLAGAAVVGAPPPPQIYQLVKTIPLGIGERWDYVTYDPAADRVYVAHGDHVTVVDAAKGAVVGEIGTFPGGTHGIGISTEDKLGYTDDGKAGMVAVFDPSSLKVVKRIVAAPDADGIVFDHASRHIFVVDGDSGVVTVIDPRTDSGIGTITIGAGLEAAVADDKGKLFVDGAENHDIVAIDTHTNAVLAHFPMPGCVRPHGIAVDAQSHRVFATCSNKVMVAVDTDNGANVATIPIGASSDGAAFDPKRNLILSPNGEGTLTVIQEKDANHFVPLGDVPTARGARTIAIDPATGRLFLPTADVAKSEPPTTPGGRPHVTYTPGSMKLLVFAPVH
ncbi:MAG TPA: YncE family protein [Rhizomicrobium sp.]